MSKPTPRRDALEAGLRVYYGQVCDLHPGLKGRRLTRNSECPNCCSAAAARHKDLAEFKGVPTGGRDMLRGLYDATHGEHFESMRRQMRDALAQLNMAPGYDTLATNEN